MAHPSWGGRTWDRWESKKTTWSHIFFYCEYKSHHFSQVEDILFNSTSLTSLTDELNHQVKCKCFFLWRLITISDLSPTTISSIPHALCTHSILHSLFQETTGYQSTICELLLPSVLGERLLLNHRMVKQWPSIFIPPWAGGTLGFTFSYFRCDGAFMTARWFLLSVQRLLSWTHFNSRKDINPQVGCWQISGTCFELQWRIGNCKTLINDKMFMCFRAHSISPTLMGCLQGRLGGHEEQ